MLDFVYSDLYLRWQLGAGHPTDPRRAENTLRLMQALRVPHRVLAPRPVTREELLTAHTPGYVDATLAGYNPEWAGLQPTLGETAALMAGGTLGAVERVLSGETVRAFNPQGAKHHAEADRGGGFCVFNDHAMAARRFNAEGWRVFVIDWDVHQGNGTEAILLDTTDTLTASIHGCYFGGGIGHDRGAASLNYQLEPGDGDRAWLTAIHAAITQAEDFDPDVVLVATGADSHMHDPLSNLNVTVEGYAEAACMVRDFANSWCGGRVIIGGAGGYRPNDWTPACWTAVAAVMADRIPE